MNVLTRSLLVVVTTIAIGVSCSSEPTASEQVCDARTELRSALSAVTDDLSTANFGQARDDFGEVTAAYDELKQSANGLATEQKEALAPDIEQLEADIRSLTSVGSLDELSTTLSTVQSEAVAIYDEVSTSLSCD